MAQIFAKGETIYGKASAKITGGEKVNTVTCDNGYLESTMRNEIKSRANLVANYAPPANSMLQAYATVCKYFGEKNVKVEGDIGAIPAGEEGDIC